MIAHRILVLGLALGITILAAGYSVSVAQQQRGGVDWILVLDTSASMRGVGGAKDIFAPVTTTLGDFIRSAKVGDSVTLYSFDRDVSTRPTVRIEDDSDRRELLKTVQQMKANGDRTYTGKAIHDALERSGELTSRADSSQRTVCVVLFTDGMEDVRGISNPISIPSNISLIPKDKDKPYVFFVSLGVDEHERQLEDFVNAPELDGRGEVIRDPGANGVEDVGEKIRKKFEAAPPPTVLNLEVSPASLDFGQVTPGGTSNERLIDLKANIDCTITPTLQQGPTGITLADNSPIKLTAGERRPLSLRISTSPDSVDGPQVVTLEFVSDDSKVVGTNVEGRLNIAHTPVWWTVSKWLGIVLLLVVLGIVALSLVKGESPLVLWKNFKGRNHLEGELELIRPRPARVEDEVINLTGQDCDALTLSSLMTDSLGPNDAELLTVKRSGAKAIEIRQVSGTVKVNSVEVTVTPLFDGDLIDIGDARLRFNWIGHERPIANDDDGFV